MCRWDDSTWQSLLQIPFDEFCDSYPLLHEWDQLVLEKSTLIAYAADWVRQETAHYYPVCHDKLVVVPFGASVFDPGDAVVESSIAARSHSLCRLTFVGVDWIRKGLPLAHSLMKRLNLLGVPTVLNVVGPRFDAPYRSSRSPTQRRLSVFHPFNSGDLFSLRLRMDNRVKRWGFLNKDVRSQYLQFCRILRTSHFLAHPADFECFGVALAEANAFGVPVLSLDNFGPRSIIESGINGYLFDPDRFVAEASALIVSRWERYDDYQHECRAAFGEYKNRLNWQTGSRRLLKIIAGAI